MPSSRKPVQFRLPENIQTILEQEAAVRNLTVNEYARRKLTDALTTDHDLSEHRDQILRQVVFIKHILLSVGLEVNELNSYGKFSGEELSKNYKEMVISPAMKRFRTELQSLGIEYG
ncbi:MULTISPECIES: hypothetical protein [Enterobacter cloacae complex]|uniref:hypothetical protein n=1 Tax=Enterobacter cloacae complex TaxID=354276 RepID=UPI000650EC76|nr:MULTISPECIES: hypothetical protein [Enterobacter cloacae complex]HBV3992569.1 hypothetical protein [Klebsiella quasipneumoniae]EJV1486708.1 hypothetical protein [Enterobacter hormaechei]EKW0710162.1 hypothetical protein [Enterobacter hormaechei]EKW0723207.1 hypothetical protein [Enterobacter hormaechei]ELC6365275.1 hypothetical protein [Enterobacter hormaechei]